MGNPVLLVWFQDILTGQNVSQRLQKNKKIYRIYFMKPWFPLDYEHTPEEGIKIIVGWNLKKKIFLDT